MAAAIWYEFLSVCRMITSFCTALLSASSSSAAFSVRTFDKKYWQKREISQCQLQIACITFQFSRQFSPYLKFKVSIFLQQYSKFSPFIIRKFLPIPLKCPHPLSYIPQFFWIRIIYIKRRNLKIVGIENLNNFFQMRQSHCNYLLFFQ